MSMVKVKEIETAFFYSLGNPKRHMFTSFVLKISIITSPTTAGFSLGCLHMGGQVQEDKALMGGGGLMRGDIDLMGGPNF